MDKTEFLSKLDGFLSQLPEIERKKHVSYYSELIDDMVESGMDEREATSKLGDPKTVADQILTDSPLPLLVKTKMRPSGGWTALTIVLLVLACPIWLPIALALLGCAIAVFFTIWAVALTFIAIVLAAFFGGLALVVAACCTLHAALAPSLILIGIGLAGMGGGILAAVGSVYAVRGIAKLTVIIAKWIKSLFIRKERAV